MKKILPQANSLETLIKVFIYFGNVKQCSVNDIANFIGFEPRQAQYYLSACIYLDLINEDMKLTKYGNQLLDEPKTIKENIYTKIISDELISKVFAREFIFGNDSKEYAESLIRELYPEYSEAVVRRRASTLKAWCEEIIANYK